MRQIARAAVIAAIPVLGISVAAAVGTASAKPGTFATAPTARTTTVRPTALPNGFKLIGSVHHERAGGGVVEARTYALRTKREVMRAGGHDLGHTITLSLFRGATPAMPKAQPGINDAAVATTVRGKEGWTLTTASGALVSAWSEHADLHVQVITSAGLPAADRTAFLDGLVAE